MACRRDWVHGNKGYDSKAVRRRVEDAGSVFNIPHQFNRKWKNCLSPYPYRGRNAIERMFGWIKGWRRIATRHNRLAQNNLAAVHIATIVCYWI